MSSAKLMCDCASVEPDLRMACMCGSSLFSLLDASVQPIKAGLPAGIQPQTERQAWRQVASLLRCLFGALLKPEGSLARLPGSCYRPRLRGNELVDWRQCLGRFPECVAKVLVYKWGLGVEAVFARSCSRVRNRSQLSATVRNRSR